jgi:hypothetical protein
MGQTVTDIRGRSPNIERAENTGRRRIDDPMLPRRSHGLGNESRRHTDAADPGKRTSKQEWLSSVPSRGCQ